VFGASLIPLAFIVLLIFLSAIPMGKAQPFQANSKQAFIVSMG